MTTDHLTPVQRQLLAEVRRDWANGDLSARDLLLAADVPARDRAAVAEAHVRLGEGLVAVSPQPGERYQEPDMWLANEWTGEAWTSVCPDDDVALTERDDDGWLICPVCGRRHNDLAEQVRREQASR